MGDKTAIEWADATWNPVSGCTRVSPGCENCYIDWAPPFRIENRHFTVPCPRCGGSGGCAADQGTCRDCDGEGMVRSHAIGATTGVQLHPDRLEQPLRWRRPRRIFVNSLSDLFHDQVTDEFIAEVFAVMACNQLWDRPSHIFMVLTKRPQRMRALLSSGQFRKQVAAAAARHTNDEHTERVHDAILFDRSGAVWPLPNVWLGVTAENQQWANIRVPQLLATPAAHRFVSCEPLLGPVLLDMLIPPIGSADTTDRTLTDPDWPGAVNAYTDQWWPTLGNPSEEADHRIEQRFGGRVDWVIAGGESGKDARPMHPDWARSLRDECSNNNVPFMFKQWGEWAPPKAALRYEPATTGRTSSTAKTPTGGHRTIYLDREGAVRDTNELTTFRIPDDWVQVARVGKRNAGNLLDDRSWLDSPTPAHQPTP